MSRLKGFRARLRSMVRRGEADARMDDEMRFHLEMATQANLRTGLAPAEARRRALLEFGGVERHREAMREERGVKWLADGWRDVRYAVRTLGRTPGFAGVAVLTIGLGVGATTALFSVTSAILLRPLPVSDPASLYVVQERRSGMVSQGTEGVRIPVERYRAYRSATGDVFTDLAAHTSRRFSLRLDEYAVPAAGVLVSGNYFRVLGLEPAAGRFFERDDEAAVVLGHGVWRSRFGEDPAVLGRVVHVDGQPLTVVGVAPRGFGGTTVGLAGDLWIPYGANRSAAGSGWDRSWVALLARLRPEVPPAAAEAAVDAVARRIPPEDARTEVHGAALERLTGLPERDRPVVAGFMGMLTGTAGLVLLIAAANIAGLLLARAVSRRREMAVRLAIGAGRGRLVRQLLTETLALFLAGAAVGLPLAWWATTLLSRIRLPVEDNLRLDMTPDLRVLLVAVGTALVVGLVFGLAPALRAARPDLTPALKDGAPAAGRAGARGRNFFVAVQLAMAVLLLVVAGLFVRTLHGALTAPQGFDADGVVIAALDLAPHGYEREAGRAFYDRLVERLAARPEVHRVALAELALLTGNRHSSDMEAADDPSRRTTVALNGVDTAYFRTLRIELVAGRGFDAGDVAGGEPVAVINETLAGRLWPGADALGRRLRAGDDEYEVVGIVRDGKYVSHSEGPTPFAFFPAAQQYSARRVLHVRSPAPPARVLDAVRRDVAALDPDVALELALPLSPVVGFTLLPQRAAAYMVGLFGLLGLVLAGTGVYGMLSYHVAQRRRELGIRIALGARGRDVVGLVVSRGALLAAAGGLVGLALAAALARLLQGFIFGISPLDPVTFVGVPLVLGLVALLASWVPARQALTADPVRALREE